MTSRHTTAVTHQRKQRAVRKGAVCRRIYRLDLATRSISSFFLIAYEFDEPRAAFWTVQTALLRRLSSDSEGEARAGRGQPRSRDLPPPRLPPPTGDSICRPPRKWLLRCGGAARGVDTVALWRATFKGGTATIHSVFRHLPYLRSPETLPAVHPCATGS